MINGPELYARILLHELVEPLAPQGVRRHDLVAVVALAGAGDDAPLDEIDEPVGEELRVDPEVLVLPKQPEYLVGDGAYPRLQRGAVRYALGDVPGDLAVVLSRGPRR